MSTSLFSSLSHGYGTLIGSVDTIMANQDNLPSNNHNSWYHRHGVTVTPRARSAPVKLTVAGGGHMNIPKTFVTRKGALLLFSAPDCMPQEPVKLHRLKRKKHLIQDILDYSSKFKTVERLSVSVLQFGSKDYVSKKASISNKDSDVFLNVLHHNDQKNLIHDLQLQPGRDTQFYLQYLKNHVRNRKHGTFFFKTKSEELQDILQHLQQTLPHCTGLHRKDSTEAASSISGKDTQSFTSSMLSAHSFRNTSHKNSLPSKKIDELIKEPFHQQFLTGKRSPVASTAMSRAVTPESVGKSNKGCHAVSLVMSRAVTPESLGEVISDKGSNTVSPAVSRLVTPESLSDVISDKENCSVSPIKSRTVTPESLASHSQLKISLKFEEDSCASETIVTEVGTQLSLYKVGQIITPNDKCKKDVMMIKQKNRTDIAPDENTNNSANAPVLIIKTPEQMLLQKSKPEMQASRRDLEWISFIEPSVKESTYVEKVFMNEKNKVNCEELEEDTKENSLLLFSKRVQKERKEKEKKALKLKENKWKTEAMKVKEKEKIKLLEEKRITTEERIKNLTEKVQVKRENKNKKQNEEGSFEVIKDTSFKPTSSAKKHSPSHRQRGTFYSNSINTLLKVTDEHSSKVNSLQINGAGKSTATLQVARVNSLLMIIL